MAKAFVVGAGVSRSAGLPLAADLLAAVAEREFSPTELEELHKFLEYVSPTFEKDVANYPDVEEFLTLVDVAESYARFAPTGLMFTRRRLSKLRRAFLAKLARFLWAGHDGIEADHPIALLARCLEPGDVVITFNYDLTVEWAIHSHAPMNDYSYNSPVRGDQILVLKPHGSIDWFLSDDLQADETRFLELFHDLAWYDGWEYDEAILSGRVPVIVPPLASKLIEHRDLQVIWKRMTSVIRSADEVFIIGYSLPEADRLTRYVLRRAIRMKKEECNVTVVNSDSAMRARFREQIHDGVKFVEQRFERWVAKLHNDRILAEEIPFE